MHTFAADSDLFRKGEVRRVLYAWGTAKAGDLAATIRKLDRDDAVAVQLEDLFWAFREGLADYYDILNKKPELLDRFKRGTNLWLTAIGTETIERFLSLPEE